MKITKSLLLTFLTLFCFLQNKIGAIDPEGKIKELETIIEKQEDVNIAKVKYLRQEIEELQKTQEQEEVEPKKKNDDLTSKEYKKIQEIKESALELFSTPDPESLKFSSISKKEILEKAKNLQKELNIFIKDLSSESLTPTPPLTEEKGPISIKIKEKISDEKSVGPSQPVEKKSEMRATPADTKATGEEPKTPTMPKIEEKPKTPTTPPTTGIGMGEMPPKTPPTTPSMPSTSMPSTGEMGMPTAPAPVTGMGASEMPAPK
ncbi:MAG: hypothetical protein WC436_00675 [Candidatus Babeliales bacterium]